MSTDSLKDMKAYFENAMDADYDYEHGKLRPNKEMQIFNQIEELIDELETYFSRINSNPKTKENV